MRLLVVRHGLAGNKEEFAATGQPDDLRPLTSEGVREFRKTARGLRRVVDHLDMLATSPLVRARQTADLLAEVYERDVVETDALRPDAAYSKFARWIARAGGEPTVAIVGHEPHLSGLAAWLIGDAEAELRLKKGGACRIDFDGTARQGAGTLAWLLQPATVRRLRGR